MLLNEYGDLISTLPIFDSHVRNASSIHGLLNGYSALGGFVLPWSRILVQPYVKYYLRMVSIKRT